jgi:hypothetical protein
MSTRETTRLGNGAIPIPGALASVVRSNVAPATLRTTPEDQGGCSYRTSEQRTSAGDVEAGHRAG